MGLMSPRDISAQGMRDKSGLREGDRTFDPLFVWHMPGTLSLLREHMHVALTNLLQRLTRSRTRRAGRARKGRRGKPMLKRRA